MHQEEIKLNQLKQEIKQPKKLIRIKDVITITGISRSYIYQLCNDNLFPKSIQLIPGGSSVAWVEGEIIQWINERIEERDMGVKGNG